MSHKTMIDGVAYEISGGKTLVNGTAYSIDKGKTLIGGTAYEVGFGSYNPVFANNTWEQIISACQNNEVPDAWVVGNTKNMAVDGTNYKIDIIGKNHDTYSDGSGTAPLTFQFNACYGTAYEMNSSATNAGGYGVTNMHATHLPAILALMPSEVQSAIKQVNKKSSKGSNSSIIETIQCKLFLLAEIEIFGSVSKSYDGEGSQYEYYSAGNSAVKKLSYSAKAWWTRSPQASSTSSFCQVTKTGTASRYSSTSKYGVAPAFCF